MGSIGNTSRHAAFDGNVHKKGIDRRRSIINTDPGTYVTTDATTIRAGQLATYDANGFVVPAGVNGQFGFFLWDKQAFGVSVNVDEAIVLNGTTATNLRRANVSNVSVRSAQNFGGTLFTVTTDYTVNTTNGTVTRVALGAIADGATVYVTYTYALIAADFQFDGTTFRNQSNDRVTGQENRTVVASDWSRIFTMEYDTTPNYATATANFRLFATAEGKVSSVNAGGTADFLGRVHQLPTSDDPFLGVTAHGNPV